MDLFLCLSTQPVMPNILAILVKKKSMNSFKDKEMNAKMNLLISFLKFSKYFILSPKIWFPYIPDSLINSNANVSQ